MDDLAKHAAEVALRLAALPPDGLRRDPQAMEAIEQLALKILNEVSAARRSGTRDIGESSGMWRVVPMRR